MSVIQLLFDMPDDINTGLLTGLYCRNGGVIRYATGPNKGQIVKHLDSIDSKVVKEAQGLGVEAFQVVKQHKKGAIIAVVGAAVVSSGVWVYNRVKNHEPKVVHKFRATLRVYIDAIREGSMDIDKIDKLMVALEELKKHKSYEKISIQLTTEELEILVNRIYEYTIKLAEDNDVELEADAFEMKNSGAIINLQSYLRAQNKIFEKVA